MPVNVVSRPGFDFLAESYQKTSKVGIHSFPAWCLALKRVSVKICWQVCLCPWTRHLTRYCLYYWVFRLVVTGSSLTRRPQRSLSPNRDTLTKKWASSNNNLTLEFNHRYLHNHNKRKSWIYLGLEHSKGSIKPLYWPCSFVLKSLKFLI